MENQTAFHGKQRLWHAYMSIAASGEDVTPGYSGSGLVYPKAFSQLAYTTNDIDHWADWWSRSHPADPLRTIHRVTHDADFGAVQTTLDDVREWFAGASTDPNFDGGSLVFTYSGHGREEDGALCLNQNTYFTADDFITACLEIKKASSSDRRLKLALILDSCYSGAFLLNVLEKVLHEYDDIFYPDYFYAACMPDEQAWEVSSVEHGLATYSRILQGRAEMEEERLWPYHPAYKDRPLRDMVVGDSGCSYATAGAQNPVMFDEHDLRVVQGLIEVWTNYDYENGLRSRKDWEAELFAWRDLFRDSIADLNRDSGFVGEFFDPVEVDSHRRDFVKKNPSARPHFGLRFPDDEVPDHLL